MINIKMKNQRLTLFLFIFFGCFQSIKMQWDFFVKMERTVLETVYGDCVLIKKGMFITYEQVAPQSNLKVGGILLRLYNDNERIVFSLDNATTGVPQSPYFDKNLPSIIICHGFTEDLDTPTIVEMARDIKSLGTSNVFIYDHNALTKVDYYLATTNAQFAGEGLGKFLGNLYANGTKNFHLIGFSLGAHVVGFAGKQFNKITGVKLDRITGVDPAGVCYFKISADKRLDKSDANKVDIIHTDFGTVGISSSIGHWDFYPNGGTLMPGCSDKICGHKRSVAYFTETVKNKNKFLAVKCPDYTSFKNSTCTKNNRNEMGFWLQSDAPYGDYYLKTGANTPYGLGEAGIV